ncbi:hypothetical protein ES703_33001 [subsurface metagenome]
MAETDRRDEIRKIKENLLRHTGLLSGHLTHLYLSSDDQQKNIMYIRREINTIITNLSLINEECPEETKEEIRICIDIGKKYAILTERDSILNERSSIDEWATRINALKLILSDSLARASRKKLFDFAQWSVRAFIFPFGGIMLQAGKLTYLRLRDNLWSELPASGILTLISFIGFIAAWYFGFQFDFESIALARVDSEKKVKIPLFQNLGKLKYLVSALTWIVTFLYFFRSVLLPTMEATSAALFSLIISTIIGYLIGFPGYKWLLEKLLSFKPATPPSA